MSERSLRSRAENPRSNWGRTNRYGWWYALGRALTLLAMAALPVQSVRAATVTWDPAGDQTNSGGAGTWDTTLLNWNDNDAAPNVAWTDLTGVDTAVFGGAAGGLVTINTGTGVTANALTFNTTGYTIAGNVAADGLTLAGATPTITVTNAGDSATISAIIAGTAGLTKAGAGALTLSGVNTYSGATTINAGTLQIAAATALGDASATNTIAFGGGTLRSTATLDLGATRTIAVGAGGGTLSAQTGTTLTASGALSGTGTLTAAGGGTIVLSADNSGFSGNVIVDSIVGNTTNTTLRLSNANALTSGIVTVNPGAAAAGGNGNQVALAGVSIGSGVSLVLNTDGGSNARATLLGESGTSTWAGGIQFGGDGLAGLNVATGATLNVNGNITAAGGGFTGTAFLRGVGTGVLNGTMNLPAGSIAKTDGGTWTINSTGNTWLNTNVSVGTLTMGIANALPSATAVTLGQNDGNNATLNLNGFNQTIASLATNPVTGLTGTKTVTSATAATLTVNGSTDSTYAGVITGASLALVKQGSGKLTLTGVNTFNGGTTIDAGATIQLGDKASNNLALVAGSAITNNGTLIFAPGTTNLTYNNPITGNGNITLDGLSTATPAGITLSGANTGFTGSYTINQGRLIFATQAAVGATSVPITVNGNATNGGQFWLNANVTISNPITLNGYGASEAAGNLGAIRFNTGTYGGTIALGSNASVNPQNTSATISGNITGGAGAQLLVGVPGTAQNGNLTITSPGGNTYSGGTLVRLGTGTLNANVASALGTGTVRIESGIVSLNVANALGVTPAPVQLAGGTLRLAVQDSTVTLGGNGLNATYYNFGTNPGIASAQFASDQLYVVPRAFARVDAGVNMPQAGASGGMPPVVMPGYTQAGAGAVQNGAMWKGLLNITNAGTYQFKGNNDDNLVLYIDGVQIGTLGVVSALTNIGSPVTLSAGSHSIVVKHTNGGGGGYARVLYNGGAGSDAPTDEVLGTDAGSVTTGSLGATALGSLDWSSGTLDLLNNATISAANFNLGNGTLTLTSQTLSTLTAAGGTITAATPTLVNQTLPFVVTGTIGEASAGLGLNIGTVGGTTGAVEFQGTNTYTGTTTVSSGQLRLNAAGGNSIAGNLTVNATNPNGDIVNVRLLQSNQIADTALVTSANGIIDLGAFSDTVGSVAINGGRIIGSGTLTVTNLGTSTLTAGSINANLGGAGGLNKTGSGTLALGGAANSYTGVTTVSSGTLLLNGGILGAGGVGNETTVNGTGQLVLNGGSNNGTEVVNVDTDTGLRVAGGTNTIGTLNYTAGATAPTLTVAASGELILNNAPTATANIAKEGAGALTFGYDVGATLPANVLHNAGALGFNVAQSFGAAAIPSGRQFKFNVDPGAGVDVTAPAGTSVIAGYAANQTLLTRINAASAGALALGVDSSNNLDFTSDATLSLGAVGLRTYSGTLTPGASGYRLGGGGGELMVTSALAGTNALTIAEAGTVILGGPQTFTGAISINGAARLRSVNNHEMGTATNTVTLSNGGTLELIGSVHDAGKKDALFGELGNPVGTSARVISVGTGGGAINVVAHGNLGNSFVITGTDALTGAGNLTKQGFGELTLVGSSNYSGNLTLAEQGGRVYLRSAGKLPNVGSITVNQSAEFILNNNGGLSTRQFPENPSSTNGNRLNDSVAITLRGGAFRLVGNDAVASNEIETVGTMTLDVGRNQIEVNSGGGTGTQGAQLNVADLVRNAGGGVLNVINSGTLGTPTGDHSRIVPALLNGAAVPASTANGTTLPWATANAASNFIAIGVTGLNGLAAAPSTSVANVTLTPVPGTRYTFTPTAAGQNLTLAAGNQEMAGLRFVTNLGTPSLRFTNAVDTLFVGDGVIIGDNNNQTRTIGLNTLRGNITAGAIAAAAGPKELFFHQNQNTLAVESIIVDNNGAVTVHKGVGGGTLELRAANTYSGGTIVHQGRINAIVAGSLGSGPVTVKGAAIELRQPGTTTSTDGFTILDRSELYLQNPTGVYNQPGDRFTLVGPGNMLTGSIANAGQGLASLTRVTSITGPGQVILPAGTHIRYQGAPNGVVDFRGPANLGTDADLYFNLAATAGGAQTITVGAGTPWKGLGSSVGTGWEVGTINANSDFYIQGLNRVGGNVTYALGASGGTGGSYTINNLSGGSINAFLEGRVDMNEDTPMVLPSNLTFVVTPGAYVVPNYSQQFGWDTIGMSRAKVLVQAGGTLDTGNFTTIGASANMPQGMPYPIPSPLNAFATFEAGSRFVINDASGVGSTTGGATWTMKSDSIMYLGTSAAFLGSNAGLINAGQFVYEPGAIVRYETGSVFKHDQFINNEPNGQRTVLEIFNANANVTDATNPFIVPAVGTPTIVPMTLAYGDGGMITNDGADRTINERRGKFLLNNGAILAGTTQTYLNIQEGIEVPLGATVSIGSSRFVDGLAKLGAVQLTGANSNVILGDIAIADGAQLAFGATNVWPDNKSLNLPTAVTSFPSPGAAALQPGNGTSLLLNVANFIEYTGAVTGNGAVIGNQGGTALGMNITSDVTSNVVFKNTNAQNPSLVKFGPNKLTLTGNSDSTGFLVAQQGEVAVTGGTANWGEIRPQRGGTITVDNTASAADNRLGTPDWLVGMGGTFELKGHATTAVIERFNNIASGSGNFINVGQFGSNSTLKITPGAAITTLSVQTLENFQSAGQRFSSFIVNSPSVANGPLTYGTAHQIIPNGTNTANGLLEVFSPNFGANAGFGIVAGGHFGSAGTAIAASRNDFLGDANGDGVPEGFMTEDGVYYTAAGTSGTNTITGLPTTTNLAVGMAVTGTGIPAGTRIASIASPTSVTLTQNLTAAGANLNVIVGGMRNLAASEYSSTFRDNQNVGLNVKLSGTTSILGDTRAQTLTMTNGSVLNINGAIPLNSTMGRLHLNSGGVFVPSGATATINGGTAGSTHSFLQTNGGTSLMLHTWGDLNLNARVWSDIAVIKTGTGTLNVGAGAFNAYRTNLQVDGGTVILASGNNLPSIRSQNGSTSNSSLVINAGTLDLNGNSQMINQLASSNEAPGMGGTITSATPATITNTGGGRFAGVLAGAISLDKNANNTLLLTSAQTYTGTTTIRAGTLVLRDSATLASSSALTINNATVQLDNGYLSNVTNRINPAIPVSVNGATINLTGAAGQVAFQTINNLTVASGLNNFTSNAGGSGANELTIGNLIRTAGGGGVVNFQQNYGFIGTAGNNTTAIRYFVNNVNGSPLALNDGILGGWAVVRGTHFATYQSSVGIGEMSNTGDGFANYDSGDATAATPTQNVNDGTGRTFAASKTINSWRMAPGANISHTLNNGVGLTIDAGAILSDANFSIAINGATDARSNFLTSNTSELFYWVNQNTNNVNVPITGAIDFVKTGGAILAVNPSIIPTATVTSGSTTIAMTNTAGIEVGDGVANGSASVFPAGTVVTAINPGVSITVNNAPTTGGADLRVVVGNTFTGRTIVNGGTLTLNQNAVGTAARAVPGDLFIAGVGSIVTEANVGGQINPAANVTIAGGGRLNLVNAANVTENLASLTFLDGSGSNGTANGLDRTGLQLTSTVNLTAATAITSTNTNPSTGVPFIGGFAGNVGFTNAGGSTLNINSPTAVNGVLAVGLRFGARISTVPTGVSEGGLIKAGTGLLTLDPDQAPTFATTGSTTIGSNVIPGVTSTSGMFPGMQISGTNIPAGSYILSVDSATQITISANAAAAGAVGTITAQPVNFFGMGNTPTEVLNIQTGVVRADRHGALGSPFAITTVQSGAVLLGANAANQVITGSVTLKSGSTLGATLNGFTLGAATDVAANQTIVSLPSGTVNIAAYDYYVPGTNSGNITINGKLTGAGNINLVGQQLMQGSGGGGTLTLGNPLLSGGGAGQNDYSGTINVGTNAILANQVALIAKNTAVTRTTGNAMGNAVINLAGGRLRLRDDGASSGDVANLTVNYGNNVTLSENSFLDANRQTSGSVTGTTIDLGTLTVAAGSKSLTVDSGNGYKVGFASLDGSGTLVKAGTGILNINAIAGGFTGGINIAGPQGVTVAPNFNTLGAPNLVLPASATLPNFSVNGLYITEASKTLNVTGTLAVNDNPGSKPTFAENVATGQRNVAGRLGVVNTTTISAGIIENNGVIGAIGGAATLTASTGFTGAGTYVTTNANAGAFTSQPLTLAGNVTGGTLRTAGVSTVSITGATHAPTATEVQSGTLKIAPAANAATSGNVTVFGSPASTAGATSAPIDAVTGTLDFAATAGNSVTHTGNITNSGLVKVSTGSATVTGSISGSATVQYAPGLLEGLVMGTTGFTTNNTRPANPGNFGIQMEPRMLQNNSVTQQAITGHLDNEVWVYTGYVKDDDGIFSFAANQDDNTGVWIDGTLVMNIGGNRVGSTAYKGTMAGNGTLDTTNVNGGTPSQNFGPGIAIPGYGSGWHLVEIRMRNGAGGAGPYANNGFQTNYGFGYKNGIGALDGSDYIKPIENGTGNLFLTPVGSKGNIQVDAGATLNAGQVTLTNRLTVAAAGSGGTVNLNPGAALASAVDNLAVTGSSGAATLTTNSNSSLTVGNFSGAAGTSLTHTGASNRLVITGNATGGSINSSTAQGVTFNSNSNQVASSVIAGSGGLVKEGTGTLNLYSSNTYSGDTQISAGTVTLGVDTAPSQVSGAAFWLDASDVSSIVKDGTDKVSAWNDKTANARNFTQATAGNQPLYVASALNGKSVIRFAGGTQQLTLGTATTPQEVFIVATPNGNTTLNGIYGQTTTGTSDKGIRMASATAWQNPGDGNDFTNGAGGAMFINGVAGASFGADNTPHILTAIHGTSVNSWSASGIGGYYTGRFFVGDVAEVLMFNTTLSTADQQAVETYLAAKWLSTSTNYIPDTSAVNIAASAALKLNNYSETIGSLAGAASASVQLGSGTLTLAPAAGSTTFSGVISGTGSLVHNGAGSHTLTSTNTYTGATAVNAGTLRVDGSIASSSGVSVAGSATFVAGATQVVKTLDLSAASSNASILAGAIRVLSVGDNTAASPLTLTGGKLDLNTSALIVDFSAGNEPANLAAMKTAILAGRGTGVWDGTSGLTSTAAAAAASVYGVGYAPSSIASGAIAGVTPDADAVVARYTRLGDANLDGSVNFFDLTALAAAYGSAGEWYNGDFDYSGTINFFDLTALAANYGTGLPSEAIPGATPEFGADLAAAFASVPEPGAISLLGLAALALLKRRNRKVA